MRRCDIQMTAQNEKRTCILTPRKSLSVPERSNLVENNKKEFIVGFEEVGVHVVHEATVACYAPDEFLIVLAP